MKHKPKELHELRAINQVSNINEEYYGHLNSLDKLAIFITERVGTIGFFLVIFVWTIFWLSWNLLAPIDLRFDPFPAFVLWLFISNMIQLMLLPLIMVGQNLQGRHAEVRAENDFKVNVKAEKEIETILEHLENQNEMILRIANHLKEKNKDK